MAIWLLKRDSDDGQSQINDSDMAIVEAASLAAARTAAEALGPFPVGWWSAASGVDISTGGTYNGGLGRQVLDLGI